MILMHYGSSMKDTLLKRDWNIVKRLSGDPVK